MGELRGNGLNTKVLALLVITIFVACKSAHAAQTQGLITERAIWDNR